MLTLTTTDCKGVEIMATTSIGGDAAPVTLPGAIPPMPAVARILARHDRTRLAAFVTVAIDLMDAMDGDADAQDTGGAEDEALTISALAYADRGPGCIASEGGDISATEWHTRGRHKDNPGIHDYRLLHEDDEEHDPSGQRDEDGVNTGGSLTFGWGGPQAAGCPISDPDHGIDDLPHDQEHDAECEQMHDDVPMLPVYSAEHNLFSDKRVRLGICNLQSSFQTNGSEVRSADTGATLVTTVHTPLVPGLPV